MAKKNIITPKTREPSQVIVPKAIENKALRFAKFVESRGVPIEKVIIFGSYAKKKAKRGSDIDLCLVSPKFGKDTIAELQFLLKQRRQIDSRIEPIPVSSKDYQKTATPLIFEVKKFGREMTL